MAPMKIKLADAQVAKAALPPGKNETVIWDSEVTGFGLRLRQGSKSYILMYRPAGAGRSENAKRYKIGTPGTIETAAEARRLAWMVPLTINPDHSCGAGHFRHTQTETASRSELNAN